MEEESKLMKKDPRNALPSWRGYEYQGQIAIITALEKMIDIQQSKGEKCIEDYAVMLEDMEDFALYYKEKRISLHQVKSTKKNSIHSYKEALYEMAKNLKMESLNINLQAYLHTSVELNDVSWQKDITIEIKGFSKEKKSELTNILDDEQKLEERVIELRKRFRKNGSFKSRRTGFWEKIYQKMDDVEKADDIVVDNLKTAIRAYINDLIMIDTAENNLLKRILYYRYKNGEKIVAETDTRNYIEELIKEYWGSEVSNYREGSENVYRYKLQEIVGRYVVDNHNAISPQKISFCEFKRILDETSIGTGEYALEKNKDLFFETQVAFCEDCEKSESVCEQCDVKMKCDWIANMTNSQLEQVFCLMSPDVNKGIGSNSNFILNKDGLSDSYFYTLNDCSEPGEILYDSMVIYQKDIHNYILTDISITKHTRTSTYRGLCENKELEKICLKILNNSDFAKKRMEFDRLIVNNPREDEVDVEELCKKIVGTSKDKEKIPSYYKITHKKNLRLINAEAFVEKII